MVKVTRYILEDLFDKYNKLYFEEKLVKPQLATYLGESTMGIFNVSERHGKVRMKILIARNVRYTQENLRDVLIHEMIHLYVYQEIGPGYGHKKPFLDKMNELNAQYGLDIRKDSRHLKDKFIRRKKDKTGLTGWLHQIRAFLPCIQ